MDRPDAGPARRAGARARASRPSPPTPRATTCSSTAAALRRYTGHDPAHQPGGARRRRAGADAGSTAWRGRCRSTRPGRRRARRSSTARPWPPGCAATWPRSAGRMLLELGVEAVWAAQPEDMSLLHVLFYIHSAGSARAAVRHRGRRPAGPLRGRLAADRAPDGRGAGRGAGRARRAGAPHRARRRRRDRARRRRDRARGRRAIVAIAPTLAGRIAYDPPLPGYRDQLTQRMPLGTVAKCMAIYDEPFWRAEGLTGQATSDARARCGSRSTTRRRTARPACCSASSRAATRASSGACRRRSGAPR